MSLCPSARAGSGVLADRPMHVVPHYSSGIWVLAAGVLACAGVAGRSAAGVAGAARRRVRRPSGLAGQWPLASASGRVGGASR